MSSARVRATYVFPQGFGWGIAFKAPPASSRAYPAWASTGFTHALVLLDWARLMPEPQREDDAAWDAVRGLLQALAPSPVGVVLASRATLPPWWAALPEAERPHEAARWAAHAAQRLGPLAAYWLPWLDLTLTEIPRAWPPRGRALPPRWQQHQAMVQALRASVPGAPVGGGGHAHEPPARGRAAPSQRPVPPTLAEFFLVWPDPAAVSDLEALLRAFALWEAPFWLLDPGPGADLHAAALATRVHRAWRAVNHNVGLQGYFAWPWSPAWSWEPTSEGLYQDEAAGERPTPTAAWFSSVARANAITPEGVATYAPEAWPVLYPAAGLGDLRVA